MRRHDESRVSRHTRSHHTRARLTSTHSSDQRLINAPVSTAPTSDPPPPRAAVSALAPHTSETRPPAKPAETGRVHDDDPTTAAQHRAR